MSLTDLDVSDHCCVGGLVDHLESSLSCLGVHGPTHLGSLNPAAGDQL